MEVKTKTMILFAAFALIVAMALAGTTPANCCDRKVADNPTPDRCTAAGTFISQSKCFTAASGQVVDRSDYFACVRCGATWCMARQKCPQACLQYEDSAGNCDCFNYYNAASASCTAVPPAGLKNCTSGSTTPTSGTGDTEAP